MDKNTKYFMLIAAAAVAVTAVLCIASVGHTDPSDADTVCNDGSVSASVSLSADTSGTCGENLTWKYDTDTKTLTISGSGEMYYPPAGNIISAPWSDLGEEIETVVLPQGLTNIYKLAFSHCPSLVSVTIPDTVLSIDRNAFSACRKLTSLELPDSITTIGFEAFYCCGSLKSINIPCNVTEIGNRVFTSCNELTEIYNYSSINIAYDKNYDRYGVLKNALVLTDTCGDHLMWKFGNGTLTLIGHGDMSDYADGGAPWYGNYMIKEIVLPDTLTHVGSYAFKNCSSLTSAVIPDSVTSIGDGAFDGCWELTSVTIGGSVASIGSCAFFDCRSLTSVTVPDSVTSIGNSAFYGCTSLTSVTVPDSVTSIGSYAFRGCSSLTSVTIGGSVTSIGSYAFRGCPVGEVYNHSDLDIKPGSYGLPKDVKIIKCDARTETRNRLAGAFPAGTGRTERPPEHFRKTGFSSMPDVLGNRPAFLPDTLVRGPPPYTLSGPISSDHSIAITRNNAKAGVITGTSHTSGVRRFMHGLRPSRPIPHRTAGSSLMKPRGRCAVNACCRQDRMRSRTLEIHISFFLINEIRYIVSIYICRKIIICDDCLK